jgi:hypothetical protein
MQEIWKDIKDYEGLYQISNLGKIKSLARKTNNQFCKEDIILKLWLSPTGYLVINLHKNGKMKYFTVHRLVLKNFVSNPLNKLEINHKDGNKQNNNLNNLEWATSSENHKHAFKLNLMDNKGEQNPQHKLTEWDVKMIRKMYKNTTYWTQQKLADLFGISRGNIYHIVNNKTWIFI